MMSDEEEIDVMGDIYDTPTLNFDSNEYVHFLFGNFFNIPFFYIPRLTECY